ncbi:MAG: hypothetical protein NT062_34595 [Proteobacteria bacterium]|nr:hypothetical protein [Pseudomonadota bacterium]
MPASEGRARPALLRLMLDGRALVTHDTHAELLAVGGLNAHLVEGLA